MLAGANTCRFSQSISCGRTSHPDSVRVGRVLADTGIGNTTTAVPLKISKTRLQFNLRYVIRVSIRFPGGE